ncbi:toll-like receptor 4 [Mytilus californianus]|uniref:toll-like receptor 4 n=1 Tax=Mytilus californianus TaxID=6549 RepID=UPI002246406E|nr:toll-like receptor 4 [Mytilus californianus]
MKLTLLTILPLVLANTTCNKYCKCSVERGQKSKIYVGICDGSSTRNLTYIPEFPDGTRKVVFINNDLQILSKESLDNISSTHSHVTDLNLKYNKIKFIHNNTFSDMIWLCKLDISGNNQLKSSDLAYSFYSLPKRYINTLVLKSMKLKPFDGMFGGLKGCKIQKIVMTNNNIETFNGTWFAQLKEFISLDINWNRISSRNLNLKGLSTLTWLHLGDNPLSEIPAFCDDGLFKLKTLHLSYTQLRSFADMKEKFRCLQSLKQLFLNGLDINQLHNNTFSELKSLKELSLMEMQGRSLKINPFAFNSSSLEQLSFYMTKGFRFSKWSAQIGFFVPHTLFAQCRNILSLDLSHNVFDFTQKAIREMFKPLQKLQNLFLENLQISYIPRYFLNQFPKLKEFSMADNKIVPWADGSSTFKGVKALQRLNLENNKISMISSKSIPSIVLDNLKKIDLSNNHFTCSCDIMWFREWMKSTKVIIKNAKEYKCDNSEFLINYNPTPENCKNIVLIIAVSVGCLVGIILFATIIVYFCRWRIRFQLYNIRSRYRNYHKLKQNNCVYAAYVIYCYEDFKWIKNKLIKEIEIEYGFKLCIPHRDFELGKVFADNIVDHMNLSKMVIPVFSNNFSKNEWCLFQLDVARSKLTKEGSLTIFPVMLEEVEFKNMNAAIYSFIKLSNYAAWSEDSNAKELFWDKIKDHLKNT